MKKRLIMILMILMVLALMTAVLSAEVLATEIIDSGSCGDDLTWQLTDDGVLTISGKGEMYDFYGQEQGWVDHTVTSVVIEDGVTSIGENAFEFCNDMESVIIPDSVTSIGACAFYICSNLTSVEIPASVTSIGANPFWGCTYLEKITVDEDNPNYSSDESGVLYNKDMTELLQVPMGLSGDYEIQNGVGYIPGFTFNGNDELNSITIPSSVTLIEEYAFDRCLNLTEVIAAEDNTYFSSDENGALYNKDKSELIYVPGGISGELSVHANVTKIAYWAFADVIGLETIRFSGDAPQCEEDGLIVWDATVYYPANNPSWTDEVKENFGFDCEITWIEYEPENNTEETETTDINENENIAAETEEETETTSEDLVGDDDGISGDEMQAIVLSILRGLGIGVAGAVVLVGIVFGVNFARKKAAKRKNTEADE